ncbi:MAG TPA: type II secretion system protein [Gemmatimonadaceae bacterium]|nr:type II secretion system protein [Gemmatimonadaceae bacterium]
MTARRAFTLPELIVSVAIAGIVAGGIATTLVRQQRFFGSAAEVLDVRSQLRDAADVLASDLRGAAVASYGLPVMTDSAIEFYTSIGTSIACSAPSGVVVALAPSVLANGNTLTSLLVTPDTGDLAAVYSIPSNDIDSARWETRRISAFSSRSLASTCPASTGFTTLADAVAGAAGYQLTLAMSPGPNVHKGAPVRFLRRARYSIYKSSDGKWYLGYRRCSVGVPSACASVQPLSGPYRPYGSRGGENGLSFRYYDVNGVEVPAGSGGRYVARIDIVIRGEASRRVALAGDAQRTFRDSVVVTVSPRNRMR